VLPNTHIEPLVSNDTLRELSKGEPGWSTGDITPEMSSLLRMTVPDIAAELLTLRALHAATTHPQNQPSPGAGARAAKAFVSLLPRWRGLGRTLLKLLPKSGTWADVAAPAPTLAITVLAQGRRGRVDAHTVQVPQATRLSALRIEAYAALERKTGIAPDRMDSVRIHFDALDHTPLEELRTTLGLSDMAMHQGLRAAQRRYDLARL